MSFMKLTHIYFGLSHNIYIKHLRSLVHQSLLDMYMYVVYLQKPLCKHGPLENGVTQKILKMLMIKLV